MTIDLNLETQLALVDELRKYVPTGEQKRIGIAVAKALGHADSTGESELSCLLNKRPDAIERLLRSDRVDKVLDAICNELELNKAELLREARRAAGRRPRPAPDRHPAWQELGEAAPWVEKVPGLQDGMETLRAALSAYGQRVVWLVGPAGSGNRPGCGARSRRRSVAWSISSPMTPSRTPFGSSTSQRIRTRGSPGRHGARPGS